MKKLLFACPLVALALGAVAAPDPDLSKTDEIVAQCKAVAADKAKKPVERARARYELIKLELLTCEDAAFAAKKAEMMDFLSKPGDLPARDYVEFLYNTVANDRQEIFDLPDVDALADAASKGDPAARAAFWTRRIGARGWGEKRSYDPNRTWERRLELIDAAEKDAEAAAKLNPGVLIKARLECYRGLDRYDDFAALVAREAEKAPKPGDRATLLTGQADFLRARAARFFSEPHGPTLREAVALYDQAAALCAGEKRLVGARPHQVALKSAAECLLAAKDYAGCRARLKTLAEVTPEKQRPNLDAAMVLGDCAFAERKWEESVTAYRSAEAKLDIKRKLNLGHALFALGRKKEALPILEFAAQKGNKYAKLRYQYDLQKLKKELEAGK